MGVARAVLDRAAIKSQNAGCACRLLWTRLSRHRTQASAGTVGVPASSFPSAIGPREVGAPTKA